MCRCIDCGREDFWYFILDGVIEVEYVIFFFWFGCWEYFLVGELFGIYL